MDLEAFFVSGKQLEPSRVPEIINSYTSKENSFIPGLLPGMAVQIPNSLFIPLLEKRLGQGDFAKALDPDATVLNGQYANLNSPAWLRRTNMVGINVRTISNFWNVVKYALTLPASQNTIHLLPIWEPGVVSSLYGIASWNINSEFFSQELFDSYPHLDTVERQLKVTANLLHAMGKVIGLDVIPHTDRYSEIVLANPHYFEWLQRKGTRIIDHSNNLHEKVQAAIFDFLKKAGSNGVICPPEKSAFFSSGFGEQNRIHALFGQLRDYGQRQRRRTDLMNFLHEKGFEPVPATMAPPYRGLQVDDSPGALSIDKGGREWRDYVIEKPEPMSRVFGPLTRYKFYENKNDNRDWEVDFSKPRKEVWEYVQLAYAKVCREYGFDFMRGDMSHVQMRPEGIPAEVDEYYDPLCAVKHFIQKEKPWFGYFAESFLAPAGVMAYGDEVDHLEMADADTTLGDLQSMVVGSPEFLQNFRLYLDILSSRKVSPSFTIMTGDKDDPRFDKFYAGGNEARLFIGLFLPDMPSYMGLGFECRDQHHSPAPNEHYTKLFVFKIDNGPKATHGEYVWGKNAGLFSNLLKIRLLAEGLLPKIKDCTTNWLLPPDPTGHKKIIAWALAEKPEYLFVVNLDWGNDMANIKIPSLQNATGEKPLDLIFSSVGSTAHALVFNGKNYPLNELKAGECRVYSLK
ncbi:MAG: hypothetical protein H6577_21430 [Lewinellaceae bacterium]|nr:hypothetical protein [Saprospiraceae bacterium]MCB9340694.1 hypothetical protein [Lewinellaceae bacterium]